MTENGVIKDQQEKKQGKKQEKETTPVLDFLREILSWKDNLINTDAIKAMKGAKEEIEASKVYTRHYGQIRNAVGRRMRRLLDQRATNTTKGE